MLASLQSQLQAIYRVDVPDVRSFLVDAAQVSEVLGPDARTADEWVLLREEEGTVALAVYIAADHLERLDGAGSPCEAIERCFPAWCAAIEGLSHFVLLVERARRSEPVSMLELEAQAEVDKFACARLIEPRRGPEVRARLFRDSSLAEGLDGEERARYREASRLAAGFCARLDGLPHTDAILGELRTFWHSSGHSRMERMRRMAA